MERNGFNVRLRIDHSLRQRALVDWKFRELAELSPLEPRVSKRFETRTGRWQVNYRFSTRTSPALNEYFVTFYDECRKKQIPAEVSEYLTSPLSVAVWYMDDGGRRGDCHSGYLNTNGYTVQDVDILKRCLSGSFGIDTVTHFAAGKPRIYIPSSQFGRFCELVRPHVIEEMQYKLL